VPDVLVHSGADNSRVFMCWTVFTQSCFWRVVDQGLLTKACVIATPEKATILSTSSRVMSFTLNMFCRMRLTSFCCFWSGWCPLSRQALSWVRRIPHAMGCEQPIHYCSKKQQRKKMTWVLLQYFMLPVSHIDKSSFVGE